MKKKRIISLLVTLIIAVVIVVAIKSVGVMDYLKPQEKLLAHKPPMGWNSWDCFGFEINEEQVKEVADYMSVNLLEYGWEYLVIDMGWYYPVEFSTRFGEKLNPPHSLDKYGRLIPDTLKFPSSRNGQGLKPLADYVHSKGLKLGIHIMRGIPWDAVEKNTPVKNSLYTAKDIADLQKICKWNKSNVGVKAVTQGGKDYYRSIIELYKSWGVDFIKIDDISREFHKNDMEVIHGLIREISPNMLISLSPGPAPIKHAEFFSKHSNLYRISNDVWDTWKHVIRQFDFCEKWYTHIKPGSWPDCDMLPLGKLRKTGADDWVASLLEDEYSNIGDEMSRFTSDEAITVMTLWTIFRSPLMFGGHFPENDSFSNTLITNPEIIEVNQNSTNNRPLFQNKEQAVWVANIPGSKAMYVAMFNLSDTEKTVEFKLDAIGFNQQCKARDLWKRSEIGVLKDKINFKIAPHASKMLKIYE